MARCRVDCRTIQRSDLVGCLQRSGVSAAKIDPVPVSGIGLGALADERFSRIGTKIVALGLAVGTPVAAGVWGPYYAAILPNMWLNAGGQSAAVRPSTIC